VSTPTISVAIANGLRAEHSEFVSQYIALAENAARTAGVQLRICRDFQRLISLNEQHGDSWPPLLPIFNPSYCTRLEENAFWIEGVNENGDTVVTSAGRRYRSGHCSLASELQSLRIFYDNPEEYVAVGGRVDVSAPSASRIFGDTLFSGALWVRPDYRQRGFTKIVPRLMRSCALVQWNTPMFWMMITPELDRLGATRAYGPWHAEPRVLMQLPTSQHDIEGLFCWMDQATLTRDITLSTKDCAPTSARPTDTHSAENPSFAVQDGTPPP
jgi:hypothetical protein